MKTESKAWIKLVCVCMLTAALTTALIGCGGSSGSDGSDDPAQSGAASEGTTPEEAAPEQTTPDAITFGTPFEFDDLTITFDPTVTATTLENQYSNLDRSTVAVLPLTITNNSDTTHGLNMFYYTAYGPDGTKLETVYTYFVEDDVAFAGETRSGATIESAMHIPYVGPGDYYIEFTKPASNDTIEVKLPLSL